MVIPVAVLYVLLWASAMALIFSARKREKREGGMRRQAEMMRRDEDAAAWLEREHRQLAKIAKRHVTWEMLVLRVSLLVIFFVMLVLAGIAEGRIAR